MAAALRFLFLSLALLAISMPSPAQFDRTTKTQKWILSGAGFGLAGSSYLLEQKVTPYTPADLAKFRTENFGGLKGWTVKQFSESARSGSDILLYSSFAFPAIVLAFDKGREDIGNAAQVCFQTASLNFALSTFAKASIESPRPFVYNPNTPIDLSLEADAKKGFYSRHVSTVSSFSFMAAQFVQEYSANRRLKSLAWIGAVMLPAITGYLRMRAGEHFFSDVMTGYLVGAAVGIAVPAFHRNKESRP